MRLTIFGSGYVGLVTGACMAETGNHVVCVDIDADKIRRLNDGQVPIYEPGLDDYIERNVEAGRLEFTTDVQKGVDHGLFDGCLGHGSILTYLDGSATAASGRCGFVPRNTMTHLRAHLTGFSEDLREGG